MSPLFSQPTIFPQSELTEELNSEPFWFDRVVSSAFDEGTLGLFGGAATTLDGLPTDQFLSPFESDHFGPSSAQSGDGERINFADLTVGMSHVPFDVRPEDLFGLAYQTAYQELFREDYNTCVPTDVMTMYDTSPPTPSITTVHTLPTSATHSPAAPADPSSMTVYAPCFDYTPQVSPLYDAIIASPPPTSPSALFHRSDSSEADGDSNYVSPPEDDEKYHPTPSTLHQISKSKYPRPVVSLPARSNSKSQKRGIASRSVKRPHRARPSRPRRRKIPSRNIQCKDAAFFVNKGSAFQCPVVGCDHIQKNQRIPDLKRHIETHGHWREPARWICCGVGMDIAHLYGTGIEQGMTNEECIEVGAYMFKGRLMIGGCMETFSRRDALKRHVDNPNIPCVGHLDSYCYYS